VSPNFLSHSNRKIIIRADVTEKMEDSCDIGTMPQVETMFIAICLPGASSRSSLSHHSIDPEFTVFEAT
jgi:hypothetical protein